MHIHEMISLHPHVKGSVNESLIRSIEHCYACAEACTSCADACLGEESVAELRQCIRLNLDCADICRTSGAVASRRTGSNEETIRLLIDTCAYVCRICGEECERHAEHHEHCRMCAEACRRCEEACRDAVFSFH